MQVLLTTVPPISDEDMPLNEMDRAWIREAIQSAHKRTGIGKVIGWIKDWGATGGVVAFLIFTAYQWSGYTEFRVHTGDRLDTIEARLRELRAPQSPSSVLAEITTLPPSEFAKSLAALQRVAEQPPSKVNASASELQRIAVQLRVTDERSPDYWPTVLQFIHFASAGLSSDVPPPGNPTHIFRGNSGFGIHFAKPIEHGVVLLDGGDLGPIEFRNSRIIFTEEPMRLRNVSFTNCVFELPVAENPPNYLKGVGRTLLASNLNSVSVPGL